MGSSFQLAAVAVMFMTAATYSQEITNPEEVDRDPIKTKLSNPGPAGGAPLVLLRLESVQAELGLTAAQRLRMSSLFESMTRERRGFFDRLIAIPFNYS